MDLYDSAIALGYVFVRTHQHNGQKTIHPIARVMSKEEFVEAAGQEVIIGTIDFYDRNHVIHVAAIKQHCGVIKARVWLPAEELAKVLRSFGAVVERTSHQGGSYLTSLD